MNNVRTCDLRYAGSGCSYIWYRVFQQPLYICPPMMIDFIVQFSLIAFCHRHLIDKICQTRNKLGIAGRHTCTIYCTLLAIIRVALVSCFWCLRYSYSFQVAIFVRTFLYWTDAFNKNGTIFSCYPIYLFPFSLFVFYFLYTCFFLQFAEETFGRLL